MRNKILALILIVLMVQFLMPALALAEDLPGVAEPEITLESEPVITEPVATESVVTEPIIIEPVVGENDTTITPIELTQPEPTVALVEAEPIVEAVLEAPKLPSNPLCTGITGDLNGDGLINKYDTEVMIQMAKGLEPRNDCADLDMDGFISAGDISLLIKLYKIDLPNHPELVAELASLKAAIDAAKNEVDSDPNSCTLGDTNGDNKIDYKDEGLLIQMMKGELPSTPAADLDGDGYVGPGDMSMLSFATHFTHKVSADITAEEKGNCDVPTASILYSKDNGATYATSIKVKKGETLTIKAVFSKPLNEFQYAFLDIDNGLPTDNFMKKDNASESILNLVINRDDELTATVSIRALNGAFTDNIVLTSGLTFVISNKKVISFGGNPVGGSYSECEVVNFGDWSDPVDGKSIREVISKVPSDCQLTIAQRKDLEKTVTAEAPVVEPAILEIPVVATQVLGEKIYADGSLLRAINDLKIFAIINGNKYHIKTVKELKTKFIGKNIIYDVDPKILELYPSMN
jgi:hypothetical protein